MRVVATVSAPSEAIATAALSELTELTSSADALSVALGVTVEAVEAAPAMVEVVTESSQDIIQSESGESGGSGGIAVVAGAAGGGILLVLLIGLAVRRKRRAGAEGAPVYNASASVDTSQIDLESSIADKEHAQMSVTTTVHGFSSSEESSIANAVVRSSERERRATQALEQWEWPSEAISWGTELESGGFGTVFEVQVGELQLAAKCVLLSKADAKERSNQKNALLREFRALQKVEHPSKSLPPFPI